MSTGDMTASELFKSLKPSHIWSLLGAVAAIAVGAFSIGKFVESTASDRAQLARESEISTLQSTIDTKTQENETMRKAMTTQSTMLNSVDSKARFLGQYVTYLEVKDELSKKLFVDLVCAMWKKDQTDRVEFEKQNVAPSVDRLINGESPQVLAMLKELNVPIHLVDEIRNIRPSGGVTRRSVEKDKRRLRDQLQSSLQRASIMKIVSFSDTETYELPNEVAVDVHNRSDCAP